ncbi:MAG: molecular chaperone DnaJ [Nitrospirae bacterium CG_4_10_14_3_um_filter_44_29]|nr:MAG: molecular chaperone DnaJ [Nitrospirae bacterium CG01_land_8_20_14_3_00_44_22]PIW90524.1 MAG: molecular chaperone DnaJ [Nitrospirae bacterium CG_4_8_14_3_um_filter_44_28]PIX88277.1 MAG: molecular chaperone DnaJ [Nitrospirae bacterium CG_4_10_14_3_um_filter_44_29]
METQAYFEDIQHYILKELRKARTSILVAVAWFTDKELYEVLCLKASDGVKVEVLITNDRINKGEYGLDFDLLKSKNGSVKFIGNRKNIDSLMHNKFCVIDSETILTGSYNWSKQAQKNYENITVIRGNKELASQFIQEFYSIQGKPLHGAIDYLKVTKRLEAIKNLITLEDEDDIKLQTDKLKKLIHNHAYDSLVKDIEACLGLIENQQYDEALKQIDDFITKFKQIAVYVDPETPELKLIINALEIQLSAIQDERTELEKTIRDFHIQHNKELGEILSKILKLRKEKLKKEAAKDKDKETEYKEAEKDYEDYKKSIEDIKDEKIIALSDEEKGELKRMYRQASKLCHPDMVSDELKDKAQCIFNELTTAYERNDIGRVRMILEDLQKGQWFVAKTEKVTEKSILKAHISELRIKIDKLLNEIIQIRKAEPYQSIVKIDNWDNYFQSAKEKLAEELKELEAEHG